MSGDDEDRLDFGEDEELEDQISLGDADEAGGWTTAQQQGMDVDPNTERQSTDRDAGHTRLSGSQQAADVGGSEEPLPVGWVTRLSRQGEMYYFHEATLLSQWDSPTESVTANTDAVETAASETRSAQPVHAAAKAAASSKSQGMSLYTLQRTCTARISIPSGLVIDHLPSFCISSRRDALPSYLSHTRLPPLDSRMPRFFSHDFLSQSIMLP